MQEEFDLSFFDEESSPEPRAEVGLVLCLSMLMADLVSARFVAQGYHWNVLGRNFNEFHKFFKKIYEDYDSAIDPLAEDIRKLGVQTPYLLKDLVAMSQVDEPLITDGNPELMLLSLLKINAQLLESTKKTFDVANNLNEQGIADFLAARINTHQKWAWQISATLGM